MTDALGKIEEWGGRKVVYLTHTSGTNRLLNSDENERRQAEGQRRLRHEVGMLRNSGRLLRTRA
jgi:hypothetical protein